MRVGPYRFFFYSLENKEPPHIHVERDDMVAKYWLDPVQLASSHGFRSRELTVLRQLVLEQRMLFLERGMATLAIDLDPTAVDVAFDEAYLRVSLADGRELAAPIEWFPRLRDASREQRDKWRLIGRGQGIHWPEVDEDISVASLLRLN